MGESKIQKRQVKAEADSGQGGAGYANGLRGSHVSQQPRTDSSPAPGQGASSCPRAGTA